MPEQNMAHDTKNMPKACEMGDESAEHGFNGSAFAPPKRKRCNIYLPPELVGKLDEYTNLKGLSFSEACMTLLDSSVTAALRQHFILNHAIAISKEDRGSISA